MLLNCETCIPAYIQLFDLLTIRQRQRLLEIAMYVNEINKLACK